MLRKIYFLSENSFSQQLSFSPMKGANSAVSNCKTKNCEKKIRMKSKLSLMLNLDLQIYIVINQTISCVTIYTPFIKARKPILWIGLQFCLNISEIIQIFQIQIFYIFSRTKKNHLFGNLRKDPKIMKITLRSNPINFIIYESQSIQIFISN